MASVANNTATLEGHMANSTVAFTGLDIAVEENKAAIDSINLRKLPVGSIIPWIAKASKESESRLELPEGI